MKNAYITPETESGKLIVAEIEKLGYKYSENDCIAVCYTEGEETGTILFNFKATYVKLNLSDLILEELPLDGIKVWATWEAKL